MVDINNAKIILQPYIASHSKGIFINLSNGNK